MRQCFSVSKAAHGLSVALIVVVGVGVRGIDVPFVRVVRVVLGRRPPVGVATLVVARTVGIGVASEDRRSAPNNQATRCRARSKQSILQAEGVSNDTSSAKIHFLKKTRRLLGHSFNYHFTLSKKLPMVSHPKCELSKSNLARRARKIT